MIAALIAIPQLATYELRSEKKLILGQYSDFVLELCCSWSFLIEPFGARFYCVAVMSFGFGCSACAYSGDVINTLRLIFLGGFLLNSWFSIAPNYSGTIFGLRNSAGHISGNPVMHFLKNIFATIFLISSFSCFTLFAAKGFLMPLVVSAFTSCEV